MTATGEIWVPVDKQEFREFLKCGVLAHGFTRLRCADCAFERLLPFSCKRRGFCLSCGGRRMAEHAASLVDEVLPRVPVRQWVLTLPYHLPAWPGITPCAARCWACTHACCSTSTLVGPARAACDGTAH